jgi:NADH:ubiquinone oxidoreductase subunit F (NADH-binding)
VGDHVTAVLTPRTNADRATWSIGAPRLLAGLDTRAALDLRAHAGVHGPLPQPDLPRLLALLDDSRLTGRGGAGFPLAAKLRALRSGAHRVIVNGSESEPAGGKDRVLLRRSPHLVLDGAVIVAAALGARHVDVGVHDAAAATALRRAAAERTGDGAVTVRVVQTAPGFVGGEARALVRGLDGKPQLPPGRRELPTGRGVVVSNAETFAQVAVLVRMGARRFAESGTSAEPGTTLLTLGGAVQRPGVVEVPIGVPLGIVLDAAGAPPLQAVIAGGYHGSWLPADPALRLSRAGLKEAGGTFGAGVLLAVDQHTCALGELARVAGWLAGESSGQCGPCLFGLPALARDVQALAAGHARALPEAMRHAQVVSGRGACSHPDGAVGFVTSGLRLLRTEIEAHLAGGCGRPVRRLLPLGTAA